MKTCADVELKDGRLLIGLSARVLRTLIGPNPGALRINRLHSRPYIELTKREQEVVGGIVRSLTNAEIAWELHLSERTVKFYVSAVLKKTGLRGRVEVGVAYGASIEEGQSDSPCEAEGGGTPRPRAVQSITPTPHLRDSGRTSEVLGKAVAKSVGMGGGRGR